MPATLLFCPNPSHKDNNFGSGPFICKFGFQDSAVLQGVIQSEHDMTLSATVVYHKKEYSIVCSSLFGAYNLYNILAAIAGALHAGVSWNMICKALAMFLGVPGRLERYALPNGATAIIDYAHNPQSYQVLFSTLRLQTHQLIVVFGSGGDRDRGRRWQMGRIAVAYADLVILTTDNPRTEDPDLIIGDILKGVAKAERYKLIIELDRKRAIHRAYQASKSGALIALVGKGAEAYQIIGRAKLPFSERAIIAAIGR